MTDRLDSLFQAAVSAMDAGRTAEFEELLEAEPALVSERLQSAGPWLREKVGDALDGFFRDPYLLWFVAEDPVRNGSLPANIGESARAIIAAARRHAVESLPDQLEYALQLVSWSWIARECGVQIELIDILVDAGASPDGKPENALVNGNVAAAEHLLQRGAKLTLAAALALGRLDEAKRLADATSPRDRQAAFILCALQGNADGLRLMIDAGVDVNAVSADLYSHATALHHAVWSGSLEAVKVLMEAGADPHARDTAEDATPLGWAEYAHSQHGEDERAQQYARIAAYLRQEGARQ